MAQLQDVVAYQPGLRNVGQAPRAPFPIPQGGRALMATIVLIHGIGQQLLSAGSLEKDCLPAVARTYRQPAIATQQ